jgi:acetyl-CoA decarbonylase/synthase complex subunit gamma
VPREGADPFDQPFVDGSHALGGRRIPRVSTRLSGGDTWGTVKVRVGIGRYDYTVEPGLYAVGNPRAEAPVLVTANYKLTFDALRRELTGLDAFILVLQTMGINVWCAAGKGTFGTDELVQRIASERLEEVVSHRRVILPQLGAPGVAAHEVKQRSGFKVVYGPIQADRIPAFLAAKNKATPEMRQKAFPISERAVLVPMELVPASKIALPLAVALALVAGLGGQTSFVAELFSAGLLAAVAVIAGTLAGAVLSPLLLPWIPGRAFAVKGTVMAVLFAVPILVLLQLAVGTMLEAPWAELVGLGLVAIAISSFAAMNFTGSSTYTSLSGVEKEMRVAVPAQLVMGVVGVGFFIGGRFYL